MHVVRIDLSDGTEVALHPYVTVLTGFDATARADLLDTLSGVIAGRSPARPGLVEVHGLLLPLEGGYVELLGPGPAGVVLGAGELRRAMVDASSDDAVANRAGPAGEPAAARGRLVELVAEAERTTAPPGPDRLAAIEAAVAVLLDAGQDHGPGLVDDVIAARRRAEAARAELEAAEREGVIRAVDPDRAAEIDRLHDAVVDAAARRGSRFRARAAEHERGAARARLDAALDAVGYSTYAAFVMGRTTPTSDRRGAARIDEARRALAAAGTELLAVARELLATTSAELEPPAAPSVGRQMASAPAPGDGRADAATLAAALVQWSDALRSTAAAGPGVLVLDDAFAGVPEQVVVEVAPTLGRLGPLTQVVVVDDLGPVARWVHAAGLAVGAVVDPGGRVA